MAVAKSSTTSFNDVIFDGHTGIVFSDLTILNTIDDLLTTSKIDIDVLFIDANGNLSVLPDVLIWGFNSANNVYYNANSVGIGIQEFSSDISYM